MKKFVKKFLALALTVSFLISGNGVVLAIHTCFSSATKQVFLFSENECCSKSETDCSSGCHNEEEELQSKCCSSEFSYLKLSAPYSLQKSVQFPPIDFFFSPVFSVEISREHQPLVFHFLPPIRSVSIPFLNHQLLI